MGGTRGAERGGGDKGGREEGDKGTERVGG